jgi:hypothetical protein
MSIELDAIPLIKHTRDDDTGKTKVLNSVYNVKVDEKRSVVEHKIPGMEGGILQDLGREPVRISFEGVIYGEGAKDALKNIRSKFKAGMPVREYTPPPPEDEPAPSQEEEAEEAVEEKADDAMASVNHIEGRVVDADGNPQADVDVKITFDGGEYTIPTDEDGYYKKDNLEPGKYTVTVDAPGYEDIIEEVEVGSS